MNVMGFDPSLTSFGVARPDGSTTALVAETGMPERKRNKKDEWAGKRNTDDDMRRLDWLDLQIQALLDSQHPDLAVIEGYSYGSGSGREAAGELGGLVRLACWRRHIRFVIVPPQSLKLFATGFSRADKGRMVGAAVRAGYTGDDSNDAVDAWWLRAFGLYANSVYTVPQLEYRDAAVNKLAWPTLQQGGAAA